MDKVSNEKAYSPITFSANVTDETKAFVENNKLVMVSCNTKKTSRWDHGTLEDWSTRPVKAQDSTEVLMVAAEELNLEGMKSAGYGLLIFPRNADKKVVDAFVKKATKILGKDKVMIGKSVNSSLYNWTTPVR